MTALISKISAAAQDVGGRLSADRTNKEQSYDYISADKILSVCGQALSKQGVMVLPQIAEQDTHLFEYTDQYGKARKRYDSRVDYNFTVTDGETSMMLTWFGMGSDYTVPDKAMYKAITSGHKYFLMKLLCVGAGNEDSEHETDEPAPAPKQTPAPAPVVKVTRPAEPTQQAKADQIAADLGFAPAPAKTNGATVKIGKNTYPMEWGKRFAAEGLYNTANPFEVDGILQKLSMPAENVSADVVYTAITVYLEAKADNRNPVDEANDYLGSIAAA